MEALNTAFDTLARTLISASFSTATDAVERPGQPQLSLQRSGSFLAGLNASPDYAHECVVIGSVRPELFVEMAWQHVLAPGSRVVPYRIDLEGLEVAVEENSRADGDAQERSSKFTFVVHYVPVRRVPLAVAASLQFWKEVAAFADRNPCFRPTFEEVLTWAQIRGIYGVGVCCQLNDLDICRILMQAFEAAGITAASTAQDVRRAFFQQALDYTHKSSATLRSEFESQLRSDASFPLDETVATPFRTDAAGVQTVLGMQHFLRFAIQHYGDSEIEGGVAVRGFEQKLIGLEERLHSIQAARFRLWPYPLLSVAADPADTPYEAFYLLAFEPAFPGGSETAAIQAARSIMTRWNAEPPTAALDLNVTLHSLGPKAVIPNFKRGRKIWSREVAVPSAAVRLRVEAAAVAESTTTPDSSGPPPLPTNPNPSVSGIKLRPALDVLHRLRHDSSHRLDEYLIGYRDRYDGITEKGARGWVTETTHDDFIPQHKIVFFRHGPSGEIVWDRAERVDKIFGR